MDDELFQEIKEALANTGLVSFGDIAQQMQETAASYRGKSPHVCNNYEGLSRLFRVLQKRRPDRFFPKAG